MDPLEIDDRYQRARALADAELMSFVHGQSFADDFIDSMETVVLWRLAREGAPLTPMTWGQMIEATDQ
tara:strand:+ start:746 stop:949 length:204 start_codon:yes stop_codon:yes gene_type:complete